MTTRTLATISDLPQEIISQITEFCWRAHQEFRPRLSRPLPLPNQPDGEVPNEDQIPPLGMGFNVGEPEVVVMGGILIGGNGQPMQPQAQAIGNNAPAEANANAQPPNQGVNVGNMAANMGALPGNNPAGLPPWLLTQMSLNLHLQLGQPVWNANVGGNNANANAGGDQGGEGGAQGVANQPAIPVQLQNLLMNNMQIWPQLVNNGLPNDANGNPNNAGDANVVANNENPADNPNGNNHPGGVLAIHLNAFQNLMGLGIMPEHLPMTEEMKEELAHSTFADGVPNNPLISLSLISKPFLFAARKLLYSRALRFHDMYQLHLFYSTLSRPTIVNDLLTLDTANVSIRQKENDLASQVKFLTISESQTISPSHHLPRAVTLGRGGGQLAFDTIKLCTNLKALEGHLNLLRSAEKSFDDTIKHLKNLNKLKWSSGIDPRIPFRLDFQRVTMLAQELPQLKRLWLTRTLTSNTVRGNQPLPFRLKTLQLDFNNFNEIEFDLLLYNSRKTLQHISLEEPRANFTKVSLMNLCRNHGETLTRLNLSLTQWSNLPEVGLNREPILDNLVAHLKVLVSLSFLGPLATHLMFDRLHDSVEDISFCNTPTIKPGRLAKILKRSDCLPRLKTLAVHDNDTYWGQNERNALWEVLRNRNVYYHGSIANFGRINNAGETDLRLGLQWEFEMDP